MPTAIPRKQSPIALPALALLAVAFFAPAGADAGGFVVKKPSQLLMLRSSGAACANHFGGILVDTIVRPDGTTEPFTLPPKTVFVATGASARASGFLADRASNIQFVADVSGAPSVRFGQAISDSDTEVLVTARTPPNYVVRADVPRCCIVGNSFISQCDVSGVVVKDK